MDIENHVKQATMQSNDGGGAAAMFVDDTFRDELADSVGTQLTEVIENSKRADDSILREEQERQSF